MMRDVLSYGLGTLIGIALMLVVFFLFVSDITQKKHGVLRNYPVIGHLRYFFEQLGEYFRQYFFSGDRDEMPFNRATRAWVYRLAKNAGGVIGFGSSYHLRQSGALVVEEKFPRVAKYVNNMNREIDMISHSCGVRHARELRREHVRIVQGAGHSSALNMLYPYPEPKPRVRVA